MEHTGPGFYPKATANAAVTVDAHKEAQVSFCGLVG
jgi:hypothetical protein